MNRHIICCITAYEDKLAINTKFINEELYYDTMSKICDVLLPQLPPAMQPIALHVIEEFFGRYNRLDFTMSTVNFDKVFEKREVEVRS